MTLQAVATDEHSYVIVDEGGQAIGRVSGTRFPLERTPPSDTVYLERGTPADAEAPPANGAAQAS